MLAAIYARYSSENQRPESIEDQVAACRRLAGQRGFSMVEDHVYSDQAQSGARKDRPGLTALLTAARLESASYRFQLATDATDAILAVDHCTLGTELEPDLAAGRGARGSWPVLGVPAWKRPSGCPLLGSRLLVALTWLPSFLQFRDTFSDAS